MDFTENQNLNNYKEAIEDKLRTVATSSQPASLYEPIRYAVEAGGKRLRPIILLSACEAVGGNPEEALDAGIAVELLHTFTLIHDDIMDADTWRRARETVHKKWDTSSAILAGDAIFVLAYQSLLRTKIKNIRPVIDLFNEGVLGVCEGQALDMTLESKSEVSNSEYLEMIEKKTGMMIAMAAAVGASIGGAKSAELKKFKEFGATLGKAFQLQDDYLEITSTRLAMGKSLGSDLAKGKKTFLLINAFKLGSEEQIEELSNILGKNEVAITDINRVREIFEECGVLDLTKKQIEKYISNSRSLLDFIEPEQRQTLLQLIDLVQSREK